MENYRMQAQNDTIEWSLSIKNGWFNKIFFINSENNKEWDTFLRKMTVLLWGSPKLCCKMGRGVPRWLTVVSAFHFQREKNAKEKIIQDNKCYLPTRWNTLHFQQSYSHKLSYNIIQHDVQWLNSVGWFFVFPPNNPAYSLLTLVLQIHQAKNSI